MLRKKMLREFRQNFGQFFSIFILSALAIALFACFRSSDIGAFQALEKFHNETNLADGWLYGENFTEENLKAVRELDFVKEAQLRTVLEGKAAGQDSAQIDVILENENTVIRPYIMEGVEFDAEDEEGVWLSQRFAEAWKLGIGDKFSIVCNGIKLTKTIRGLIASPEYEYMCSDEDLEVDFKNIGYAYMSAKAFGGIEYVRYLVENSGDIFAEMIENTGAENDADGMDLSFSLPYTQLLFTTDVEDVMTLEDDISDAVDGNYAVFIDQDSIAGIKVFADELNQHEQFSYAFMVIFVLIAILVIITTMARMVEKQRTQIGTMNALGMKRRKIAFHYVGYSFFISLAGVIAGVIIGPALGKFTNDIFTMYYTVPEWSVGYDASFIIVSALVVLACTITSYLSCKKLLKVHPSEALRPAPPKAGKKCIFERLPFWGRLGFSARYNLRDISRSKLRAFMGIFGTACGMMLMVCAFGAFDTLDNVYEWTFEKLQNYDYEMLLDEEISLDEADGLAKEFSGELIMTAGIEVAAKEHALAGEKSTTSLVVTEGKGHYNVTDVEQNVTAIPPGEVALTSKLAERLGISEGDMVYWHIYEENEWHSAKVGVISRNPTVTGITMLREDFEKDDEEFSPSQLLTDTDISGYEDDAVVTIYNSEDILAAYQESMEIMNLLIVFFVGFAAVLIIAVLYNSGNLSFNERVKEFATLKVMGFRSGQIRRLLALQNLWLTVVGLLAGAPFGLSLLQYMFDSNGDAWDYRAVISVPTYFLSGGMVLLVSVLVSFLFARRIRRLDMVEVLKGLE